MNVTNKTTRTFTISDITEDQATDLLEISCNNDEHYNGTLQETLNNLRQALLNVGVKPRGR